MSEATPECMVSPEADALRAEYDKLVVVATKARAQGMDPSTSPDSTVAQDVAERVEKSVGPPGIAARIRELSPLIPREEVALKIAEEIALSNFTTKGEGAVDQAVRTAAAILDEGVTAAPLQGINAVKVKTNPDNTKYLAIYFAGPIRSAGGTDMGLIVVVADYVRQIVGLDRYKATDLDAKRFVEELRLYERDVARFQFHLPDALVHNVIMQLPVEVSGVETDKIEVSAYRNVPRIETNGVRGGALRVVNDGIMGRSQKVIKMIDKLSILGWDWLKEMHQPTEVDTKEAKEFMFMQDVIAGRPIFSFPGRPGGFRLRYGRSRATGLSAVGVHPATMSIVKDFIAIGTQLKMEKPGKAGIVTPVDTIEPPVVLLKDGSVIRVESVEKAREVRDSVESILSLGDVLVGFGEFLENNRPLVASGFVEEWWAQLLKSSIELGQGTLQKAAETTGIAADRLTAFLEHPLRTIPSPAESLAISKKLQTPLHPRYTWFWNQLTANDWLMMREKLVPHLDGRTGKVSFPLDPVIKGYLETLCIPHTVENGEIVLGDDAIVLAECLGAGRELPKNLGANGLEAVGAAAGFPVYSRAGAFIGTRMGRPEKAKRREMKPVTHCLFPVGFTGGPRRNIVDAAKGKSVVEAEIVRRKCKSCGEITHLNKCPQCGGETEMEMVCPRCRKVFPKETTMCPVCNTKCFPYDKRMVTVSDLWDAACKKLKLDKPPDMVKGVKGLTSGSKLAEPLEKGILRAMNDLSMFKDGTVRFDATNAPLTHFRPVEVGATVEQLKKLGYTTDTYDEEFERPDQLLSIKLQDVVVSEACGDYLVRVAKFVDDLLERFYGLEPYYRVKSRSDLVGQLVVGLSPHTFAGVIGRIIGFTKAKVCYAHPFWHAAKRRDADGDEDSVTLTLDVLLNFSKAYLPSQIGGIMDAPILMTVALRPNEVARQVFNIETAESLPIAFFQEAAKGTDPKDLIDLIPIMSQRHGVEQMLRPVGFTHEVGDMNSGTFDGAYSLLPTMLDKMSAQLDLAERIRAVIAPEVAKRVLSTHLMKDLVGNLRAFATQRVRCMKCNTKYRRPPLKGVCLRCGGKILMTVHRGNVEKYLDVARNLVKRYDLGIYSSQRLLMLQEELKSLFTEDVAGKKKEEEKKQRADKKREDAKNQPSLSDFL